MVEKRDFKCRKRRKRKGKVVRIKNINKVVCKPILVCKCKKRRKRRRKMYD